MTQSSQAVSGGIKVMLRIEGLCALITAVALYQHAHSSWTQFFLLFFVPDLSFAGYLFGARIGAIAYNTAHSYIVPLLLGALFCWLDINNATPFLFIWIAHIGFDRALGYGLKYATNFGDTHLGKIGKWAENPDNA